MARTPSQTTNWVAGILHEKGLIDNFEVVGPYLLQGSRPRRSDFTLGVISEKAVLRKHVSLFLSDKPPDFITNVPKDSYWTGDAINALKEEQVAFGGIGDLMSALGSENLCEYINREFDFVERGLLQHSRVLRLHRAFDRVYVIDRQGLPSLSVLLINQYEMTAEHIRAARGKYDQFDLILNSNPNGRATASALAVANTLNAGIFKWGQLLGRLNSP